jgi:hypothetical protein
VSITPSDKETFLIIIQSTEMYWGKNEIIIFVIFTNHKLLSIFRLSNQENEVIGEQTGIGCENISTYGFRVVKFSLVFLGSEWSNFVSFSWAQSGRILSRLLRLRVVEFSLVFLGSEWSNFLSSSWAQSDRISSRLLGLRVVEFPLAFLGSQLSNFVSSAWAQSGRIFPCLLHLKNEIGTSSETLGFQRDFK